MIFVIIDINYKYMSIFEVNDMSSIKKRQKRVFNIPVKEIIIIFLLFFAGVFILLDPNALCRMLSFVFPNLMALYGEPLRNFISHLGSVLITASIVDAVFSIKHDKELNNRMNDFENRLEENINELQSSVGITKGALEIGMTAVYATRKKAIKAIREKMEDIGKKCSESNQRFLIKILGISLGDYLCPHGPLYQEFKELIAMKNVNIEILLLRDGSYSAIQRARIEESYVFEFYKNELKKRKDVSLNCEKYKMVSHSEPYDCKFCDVASDININAGDCYSYLQTKCHNELRTATLFLYNLCNNEKKMKEDVIRNRQAASGYNKLSNIEQEKWLEQHKAHIDSDFIAEKHKWLDRWKRIKSYDYAPLLLMIEFDDVMFVENYHLASRGGESPVIKIKKDTDLFRIYDNHFYKLFSEPGLSGPIDSCACLNKPCAEGIAISNIINKEETK